MGLLVDLVATTPLEKVSLTLDQWIPQRTMDEDNWELGCCCCKKRASLLVEFSSENPN